MSDMISNQTRSDRCAWSGSRGFITSTNVAVSSILRRHETGSANSNTTVLGIRAAHVRTVVRG